MEFLKSFKHRSLLNEIIYIVLNVALAVMLLLMVRVTDSLLPAFLLVLLSKWRVLAVRPRYWFANVQADLVSVIVSLGYVVLLHGLNSNTVADANSVLIAQCALMLFYIVWLLFLKPKSKRVYVVGQAAVALFVGVTALYTVSYNWIAAPVVILMWLIGYATARHAMGSYDDESHIVLLSLAWGFLVAEIGWLAYHWTIAYPLPFLNVVLIPQVSIITLCLAFLAYKTYDSFYHHQKVRTVDIILPLIFTVGITAMLTLVFNSIGAL